MTLYYVAEREKTIKGQPVINDHQVFTRPPLDCSQGSKLTLAPRDQNIWEKYKTSDFTFYHPARNKYYI